MNDLNLGMVVSYDAHNEKLHQQQQQQQEEQQLQDQGQISGGHSQGPLNSMNPSIYGSSTGSSPSAAAAAAAAVASVSASAASSSPTAEGHLGMGLYRSSENDDVNNDPRPAAAYYVTCIFLLYVFGLSIVLVHYMNAAYGPWSWTLSDLWDELYRPPLTPQNQQQTQGLQEDEEVGDERGNRLPQNDGISVQNVGAVNASNRSFPSRTSSLRTSLFGSIITSKNGVRKFRRNSSYVESGSSNCTPMTTVGTKEIELPNGASTSFILGDSGNPKIIVEKFNIENEKKILNPKDISLQMEKRMLTVEEDSEAEGMENDKNGATAASNSRAVRFMCDEKNVPANIEIVGQTNSENVEDFGQDEDFVSSSSSSKEEEVNEGGRRRGKQSPRCSCPKEEKVGGGKLGESASNATTTDNSSEPTSSSESSLCHQMQREPSQTASTSVFLNKQQEEVSNFSPEESQNFDVEYCQNVTTKTSNKNDNENSTSRVLSVRPKHVLTSICNNNNTPPLPQKKALVTDIF